MEKLLAFLGPLSDSPNVVTCMQANATNPCGFCDLVKLFNNILAFISDLVVIVAVLMVVWGGFNIMVAGMSGAVSRKEAGTKIIRTAIIGVVITLSAWMIVGVTINILTGSTEPWKFYQIRC